MLGGDTETTAADGIAAADGASTLTDGATAGAAGVHAEASSATPPARGAAKYPLLLLGSVFTVPW